MDVKGTVDDVAELRRLASLLSRRSLIGVILFLLIIGGGAIGWFWKLNPILQTFTTPPGTVVGIISDISDAPSGWFICDGTPRSRGAFPALAHALDPYGNQSDFKLPDLRGLFLRGAGCNGDGSKPPVGSDSRKAGSWQADAFAKHRHSSDNVVDVGMGNVPPSSGKDSGVDRVSTLVTIGPGNGPIGTLNTALGGDETRPTNVAVVWIIKY